MSSITVVTKTSDDFLDSQSKNENFESSKLKRGLSQRFFSSRFITLFLSGNLEAHNIFSFFFPSNESVSQKSQFIALKISMNKIRERERKETTAASL